jgi:Family of unknown function (DUF6194)
VTGGGPAAPDETEVTAYILDTFDGVDIVSADGGTFFSIDPETHWPNFATLVTTDAFDQASDLGRPGVYRLNIGVGRATFDGLVAPGVEHDPTALDRFFPHPVYARQRWVSVINPSRATWDEIVKPLLAEAYGILARRKATARTVPADD